MSFDLTEKDKKLLTALGVLVVVVLFLHFGIIPTAKKISVLNEDIYVATQDVQEIELKAARLPMEQFDNVDYQEKIDLYSSVFFEDLNCEDVDAILTGLAAEYGLYVYNMDINMYDESGFAPYVYSDLAQSSGIYDENREYPVEIASVNMSVGGTNRGIWKFIDGVYGMNSSIRLSSFNWTEINDDSGEAVKSLSIMIKLYSNRRER